MFFSFRTKSIFFFIFLDSPEWLISFNEVDFSLCLLLVHNFCFSELDTWSEGKFYILACKLIIFAFNVRSHLAYINFFYLCSVSWVRSNRRIWFSYWVIVWPNIRAIFVSDVLFNIFVSSIFWNFGVIVCVWWRLIVKLILIRRSIRHLILIQIFMTCLNIVSLVLLRARSTLVMYTLFPIFWEIISIFHLSFQSYSNWWFLLLLLMNILSL